MSEDFNAWYGGDSIPSCSFKGEPEITWEGKITDLTTKQATEYDPDNPGQGKPKFFDDGNPIIEGWVTLQTEVRDPQREGDDGRRVLVLDSRNKREAFKQAVRDAGERRPAVGGWVSVTFFGRDPKGKNQDNLPKLYRATYRPPTPEEADPWAVGPPTSNASAATATAGPADATTPAPPGGNGGGGVDPEILSFLASKGVDISKVNDEGTAKMLAAAYQ